MSIGVVGLVGIGRCGNFSQKLDGVGSTKDFNCGRLFFSLAVKRGNLNCFFGTRVVLCQQRRRDEDTPYASGLIPKNMTNLSHYSLYMLYKEAENLCNTNKDSKFFVEWDAPAPLGG